MPFAGVVAWLTGLGAVKLAGLLSTIGVAILAFYKFSFEICLMGAMVSLLFSMFGFKLARTAVLFFIALYVVTQVVGVAVCSAR